MGSRSALLNKAVLIIAACLNNLVCIDNAPYAVVVCRSTTRITGVGVPISIRLDDDIRDELENQARSQGIGLATLLRDLATRAARNARRRRIRDASEAVAHHAAGSMEGKAFYEDWGTPGVDAH